MYTWENEHFEPKKWRWMEDEVPFRWKMRFLFNWVLFRLQPLIFRCVCITSYHWSELCTVTMVYLYFKKGYAQFPS